MSQIIISGGEEADVRGEEGANVPLRPANTRLLCDYCGFCSAILINLRFARLHQAI